jgi:hypothetical protein
VDREVGRRTAGLDGAGVTLFIEKEKAWSIGWDDIAEASFRWGDKYQVGRYSSRRDTELVLTDRRKKEYFLSEFDDLQNEKLQELFGALKERLKDREVRFGSLEDLERRDGP